MTPSFFQAPSSERYALRNLRAPRCLLAAPLPGEPTQLVAVDLLVDRGRIAAIEPAGTLPADAGPDLDASMVLPGFVDVHTHLDKGHIWPREPNPLGDVPSASAATMKDRQAHWHAEDVRQRMEFGLATAYAKGVVAIRTHLDSLAPQAGISFPLFRAMRDRWAGRIELQASSIAPLDVFLRDEGRELADEVAASGARLGAVTRFGYQTAPMHPQLHEGLHALFRLAEERGLDLDLHVDESTDPAARSLREVARVALERGFQGRILCGHTTALALQTDAYIAETLAACREANIDFVSLPTVNMYLQDRQGAQRTPRWRGTTVLHEIKKAGLRVAVAGDNCRDPFHAYGDHDMLDTFTQAVKIAHLDHPVGDWITAATRVPAAIMGVEHGTLQVGRAADLVVLRARAWSELLARHQADRGVIRAGRSIDTTPPDYRSLDAVVGAPSLDD